MNIDLHGVSLLLGLICFVIAAVAVYPKVAARVYFPQPQITWLAIGLFFTHLPDFWNVAEAAGWW